MTRSESWGTPFWLIGKLQERFGPFDLDPCAWSDRILPGFKAHRTEKGCDGPWIGKVFINPPFDNIEPWIQKAKEENAKGNLDLAVFLLPGYMERAYTKELIDMGADLVTVRGKVAYTRPGLLNGQRPRFGSIVWVYPGPGSLGEPILAKGVRS